MGNHAVDGPKMSVDEVKETLRQEMAAEFSAMNAGIDTKESLRREIMAEINIVLMGAGQDAKEYLREEMAAEIKAAMRGEITNARDDIQQDPTTSVNIVISETVDVASANDFETIDIAMTSVPV